MPTSPPQPEPRRTHHDPHPRARHGPPTSRPAENMHRGKHLCSTRPQQQQNNWHHRGPPNSPTGTTHSWLYAPLLLAATSRLAPETLQQWANHPSAEDTWERLVSALQRANPIPWQQLHHILLIARVPRQPYTGRVSLTRRLQAAGAQQPAGRKCIFPGPWVNSCRKTGTSPATAQETLLQAYLGEHVASQRHPWPSWGQHGPVDTATGQHALGTRPTTSRPSTARPSPTARPALTGNPPHRAPAPPQPDRDSSSDDAASSSSSSASSASSSSERPSPQATDQDPPSNQSNFQTARAEPASHSKGDAFRKHLLVSTFSMRRTSWSSLSWTLATVINSAPNNNSLEHERAWKLWLLLPGCCATVRRIPKPQVLARFTQFFEGTWPDLLAASAAPGQSRQPPSAAPNQPTKSQPRYPAHPPGRRPGKHSSQRPSHQATMTLILRSQTQLPDHNTHANTIDQ